MRSATANELRTKRPGSESSNALPPFALHQTSTLPEMRKELREQLHLALKTASQKKKKKKEEEEDLEEDLEEEDRDRDLCNGENEDNDDEKKMSISIERLLEVCDGNLSLLITGEKRFCTYQRCDMFVNEFDPQRVSVIVEGDLGVFNEFDVVVILIESESINDIVEVLRRAVRRVGIENVFIGAFVKECFSNCANDYDEETELKMKLESVRSATYRDDDNSRSQSNNDNNPNNNSEGEQFSDDYFDDDAIEEYSKEQVDIMLNKAKGTIRDVEKNKAEIPAVNINRNENDLTEFERLTLKREPISVPELSPKSITTTKTPKSPNIISKISFPSDEGEDAKQELFLRAEALLWNIALSSGIDPKNACAFEHNKEGGKNSKETMTFDRREQIEWVKEIKKALEKIEEARLRQVKSQLANVYVEASGIDALEVGLISPEKLAKRSK